MKRYKTLQKYLSMLLSICILFEMIPSATITKIFAATDHTATNTASHLPNVERVGEYTFPYTHTVDEDEPEVRSLEELKASDAVTLDKTGKVIKIDLELDEFTMEELDLLLRNGKPRPSVHKNPALESSGLSASVFEKASRLHGGDNAFSRELAALNDGAQDDDLDESEFASIKELICSGYTYRQARAALVSADILGIPLTKLCAEKETELAQLDDYSTDDMSETDVFPVTLQESLSASDGTADERTMRLALKMGIPSNVLAEYLDSNTATRDNLSTMFETAVVNRYDSMTTEGADNVEEASVDSLQ